MNHPKTDSILAVLNAHEPRLRLHSDHDHEVERPLHHRDGSWRPPRSVLRGWRHADAGIEQNVH